MMPPRMVVPRAPWVEHFPPVAVHASVKQRDAHPAYMPAKSGDGVAALQLARDLLATADIAGAFGAFGAARDAILLPVHAEEETGFNAIPLGFARLLSGVLDAAVELDIVQINIVAHTRADGFHRLAHQPLFGGRVQAEASYILVDDHFGMGGTLANLRGFVLADGGNVLGCVTLTASRNNDIIALSAETRRALQAKHGQELQDYIESEFGFGVESLTEPEAAYLCRVKDVVTIRSRIAAAKGAG